MIKKEDLLFLIFERLVISNPQNVNELPMKSPAHTLIFILILSAALLSVIISCSDSNLEPIGGMPADEQPMENAGEEETEETEESSEVSENPILRLNCGGDEIGYGDTVFTEDNFFGGDTMDYENSAITDVMETDMDGIYVQQRTSIDEFGNFDYAIPITNGTYILKLHFAEIFYGAPGGGAGEPNVRVFDVEVEGTVLLADLDIFEEIGALTALIKEIEVTIEDQELNIRTSASADRPALAAIEVLGDGQILN
ncbi:MAG: malectin [Eudoraea sp.]|nr:malectin [Eudoraea sp.]